VPAGRLIIGGGVQRHGPTDEDSGDNGACEEPAPTGQCPANSGLHPETSYASCDPKMRITFAGSGLRQPEVT
jgi:hypothetical protein